MLPSFLHLILFNTVYLFIVINLQFYFFYCKQLIQMYYLTCIFCKVIRIWTVPRGRQLICHLTQLLTIYSSLKGTHFLWIFPNFGMSFYLFIYLLLSFSCVCHRTMTVWHTTEITIWFINWASPLQNLYRKKYVIIICLIINVWISSNTNSAAK